MVERTPRLDWSDVTDPSGVAYDLQVSRTAGFSQLSLSKEGLTASQYQVSQQETLELVKAANPYYWRVRAVDGAGNQSAWSASGTFYTQDSTPPQQPVTITPEDGTQTSTRPRFDWSDVTDPSGLTYQLQVGLDAGFTRLILQKSGLADSNYQVAAAEEFPPVKRANSYYWRVRAVDSAQNEGPWSAPFSFYTVDSTPPPVPVPLNPANGTSTGSTPSFDWTDVSDPSGVTYILQVAQDSGVTRIIAQKQGLTKSEYRLSSAEKLAVSTGKPLNPYYWRVGADDGADNLSGFSTANPFYVRGFLQLFQGWLGYVALVILGILLFAGGLLLGRRWGLKGGRLPTRQPPVFR
jgi:hypothetical protein